VSGRPRFPGASDDERLRAVFHEMHAADMPAPAYESPDVATDAPAASASTARPVRNPSFASARTPAVARAAWAFAAAVAACAVVLALRDGAPAPGEDETLQLVASLATWEAPTDFLLTTPGAAFLQSGPRLGAGTEMLSDDPGDLLQNETNENDTEVFP
jgi:hypothetical protein